MAKERTKQAKRLLNPPEPGEEWNAERVLKAFDAVMEAMKGFSPDITEKSKAFRMAEWTKKTIDATKNKNR